MVINIDTQEYIHCINKLPNFQQLHDRIFFLCCNTDASHINMADGAYYR